ncbi:hypothetical protein GSY74_10300, partial [Sulfurovum sp. bin170]|uniref:Rpn family recombination-promoting nuclease/putative transposase n=1 Tax=Sulfurovum sp. bin170 TaxID=2695268 RepID=UPI0014184556
NQKEMLGVKKIESIFPEYYILKLKKFDDNAKDGLDEWIYFLKNAKIKDSFTAKGIKKAQKEFDVINLKKEERIAYSEYQSNLHYEASMIFSSYGVGKLEGMKEERENSEKKIKQEKKKRERDIAKNLLDILDVETISIKTGLTIEEVEGLKKRAINLYGKNDFMNIP